jgi:dihydrofolate reductase
LPALTYLIGNSADGFVADTDGDAEVRPVPDAFLGFLCDAYPETLPAPARAALGIDDRPNRHFDTVVMGRHTYQPALDAGLTSPYPHLAQYVISRTLDPHDHGSVNISDDPVALIRSLKASGGPGIWLAGGPTLAAAISDHLDRIVTKTYPVVLGDGRRMLPTTVRPLELTLEWSEPCPGGVVCRPTPSTTSSPSLHPLGRGVPAWARCRWPSSTRLRSRSVSVRTAPGALWARRRHVLGSEALDRVDDCPSPDGQAAGEGALGGRL